MTVVQELTLSVEEYLAREATAEVRSEYWKGLVIPMPGGTRSHSRIINDLNAFLTTKLLEGEYEVFGGEQRIKVFNRGYAYPDGAIVIGEAQFSDDGGIDNLLNPTVLIEVLSKSTEAFDQNEKFDFYAQMPSFEEYLLVSQDKPYIQQFTRQADNRWLRTVYSGIDATLTLVSVPCTVPLTAIYRRIEFS
jgi:Uma2 family endonuclease